MAISLNSIAQMLSWRIETQNFMVLRVKPAWSTNYLTL